MINVFKETAGSFKRWPFLNVASIAGLTLGITTFLLTVSYSVFELGFDGWIKDSGRILRVDTSYNPVGQPSSLTPFAPGPLRHALAEVGGPIVHSARALASKAAISTDHQKQQLAILNVDPEFLELFQFPLQAGSMEDSLSRPDGIALTAHEAVRLFGRLNVLGSEVRIRDTSYQVTAVLKDLPEDTSLKFDALLPLAALSPERIQEIDSSWTSLRAALYLKLAPEATAATIAQAITAAYSRFAPRDLYESAQGGGPLMESKVVALTDVHLKGASAGSTSFTPSTEVITLFISIGIAVVLLASMNYANLIAVQTLDRTREFGIKKAIGAPPRLLISEILGQSLAVSLIAIFLSLALGALLLPAMSAFTATPLSVTLFLNGRMIGFLFLLWVAVGVGSVSYPVYMVVGINPSRVLSGRGGAEVGSVITLRRFLTLLQFVCATGLSAVALSLAAQMHFIAVTNPLAKLGPKLLAQIPQSASSPETAAFRDRIGHLGVGVSVVGSANPPGANVNQYLQLVAPKPPLVPITLNYEYVTPGFLSAYRFEPVAGKVFDWRHEGQADETDMHSVVLNVSAVRSLGFGNPSAAIGQPLKALVRGKPTLVQIIGVVPDLQVVNKVEAGRPAMYVVDESKISWVTISSERLTSSLEDDVRLESSLTFPGDDLEVYWLSKDLASRLAGYTHATLLFSCAALLALCIACIGILALSGHAVRLREREISIRRVLGAGLAKVTILISRELLSPVLAGSIVGMVLAFIYLRGYMLRFAVLAPNGALPFLFASLCAVACAAVGAGYSIRWAGRVSLATSLR